MDGRSARLLEFLQRYAGTSAHLLLKNQLQKAAIQDVNDASDIELMNLTESIVRDILRPILSRGRLRLARSELMGVLGLKPAYAGIPQEIDGVRVLPEKILEMTEDHYNSATEFVLKQEMNRYNIPDLMETDSPTRIRLIEAFVDYHFGPTGKAIIDRRIEELRLKDIENAPQYNKLMLMEFILQDMLLFYIKPLKGKLLRSELVSLIGVDLELAQGPVPEQERAQRQVQTARENLTIRRSNAKRNEVVDLLVFLAKREFSRNGILDVKNVPLNVRVRILAAVMVMMFGNMTKYVLSRLETKDERMLSKFLVLYVKNYLKQFMLAEDAEKVKEHMRSLFQLPE
ncbi:MAG: hypothetical protein GF416_09090 [Candidatus Altiarchaeales archaeon]|nr:hypothetical protein [Candidatus Altiarchaeales archaeon]MBD3417273.1 hypothetical protein [Candidatus Altiarchaeales archaeon]